MLNGSALRDDRMCRALKLAAMLSTVISTTMPIAARAQTPSPLAEWQYSVGIPLEKLYNEPTPDWQARLGLGVTVHPRYDGGANYHAMVGPTIDVRYRDLFFLSTGEGLGVNLVRTTHWRAGLAITYDLGRRAQDNSGHLDGMGNINPAPEAKLFAEYAVSKDFPLVIRADIRRNLGGSDGWIGDLGAYMPLPGSSEMFYWFAGPNLVFADSRYMQTWYGVSSLQSARSGYPQYDASAGLKSVGFGVSAIWFFQKHWFVTGDAGLQQLVGDAARSPVTRKATNAVFDFSFNYQF